jgi:hypothetical protein
MITWDWFQCKLLEVQSLDEKVGTFKSFVMFYQITIKKCSLNHFNFPASQAPHQ